MLKKWLAVLPMAALSMSSFGGIFECKVNLQNVLVYRDGSVNVRHTGRSDFTYICNLNSPRQGVAITTLRNVE